MQPTNPAFCGRPFYYPPPMGPEGMTLGAAAGAAPHYAYHHHYRPRFTFAKRFFWFAIGAGVATWWFRKQERKRLAASGGSDKRPDWCGTRSHRAMHDTPPPPAYPNQPTLAAPATMQTNQQQAPPTLDSALPAAMTGAASSPANEGVSSHDAVDNTETRRSGWWHRQHSHSGTSAPSTPASVAIEKERAKTASGPSNTTNTDTEAELERLYASAEALWEQRRREALDASHTVQVRAREHVNDGLERLIGALERIREGLADEKKRADVKGAEEQTKRWI